MWDADGNRYLDLLGGIAVNALGHAHPALVSAVSRRSSAPSATSPTSSPPSRRSRWPSGCSSCSARPGKVFFANSGTEANEAAFKLTRRTGRTHLVAMEGGFHGRTMGALALTSKAGLPGAVRAAARRGDLRAVRRRRRAGRRRRPTRPPPSWSSRSRARPACCSRRTDFLARAREITTAARRAAVVRRGADRHRPHRRLVRPHRARVSPPTWSPSPRASAAASRSAPASRSASRSTCSSPATTAPPSAATRSRPRPRSRCIDTIEKDDLLGNATTVGEHRCGPGWRTRTSPSVRGRGLLIGLDLDADRAAEVVQAAQDARLHPQRPARARIRLAPPLVLTDEQAEELLAAWPAILDEAYAALADGTPRDPALPARRRPHPGRAGRGAGARRRGSRPTGSPSSRWPARAPSPCCSTSRRCAPRSPSPPASPSSAASR